MKVLLAEVARVLDVPALRRVGGSGGDINEGAVIEGAGRRWFVKWNRDAPPGFFAAEAAGLEALHAAGTELVIPRPLAWADEQGSVPAYLLLEYVEFGRPSDAAESMGRGLAALHDAIGASHGGLEDNYIGSLPQPNPDTPTWPAFYRDARIRAQMRLGEQSGRMPRSLLRTLDALCARLEERIPDAPPSLLHGDLWGGNWSGVAGGGASIFDPAAYCGSAEMDLAMSQLFGGFPPGFYAAYDEARGIPAGYDERRELMQLYPVLVHVNLFGGGYAAQAERIARAYL